MKLLAFKKSLQAGASALISQKSPVHIHSEEQSARRFSLRLFIAILLVSLSTASFAAEPLEIKMSVDKVVQAEGKESSLPAEKVKPGDTVRYTAKYRNTSALPLRDLNAVVPIPAGMDYTPGKDLPAPSRASLDGKTFETIPLKRKVKMADGSEQWQVVPASEYRAVSWSVAELAANQSVQLAVRATIANAAKQQPFQKP